LSNWATVEDFTARWVGDNRPTDETLIQVLLDDAETVVVSEYPKIQDRIDDSLLPVELVRMVVCNMVSRVFRNPEQLVQVSNRVGPFSEAKTFVGRKDGLYMTEQEKQMLGPTGLGKAFEINLGSDATGEFSTYSNIEDSWIDASWY
jgi:hypothetical protein